MGIGLDPLGNGWVFFLGFFAVIFGVGEGKLDFKNGCRCLRRFERARGRRGLCRLISQWKPKARATELAGARFFDAKEALKNA